MDLTRSEQSSLLDSMLEMGELLLDCGAEVSRVEDTLSRLGAAYGAARTDVFVIPSIISISMEFAGEKALTETRRIHSNGSNDFYRLEKLNTLSRSCCADPLPLPELRRSLDMVAAGHKPLRVILGGSVLAAFARAVKRMADRGDKGCKTVLDVAPADVSPIPRAELIAHRL